MHAKPIAVEQVQPVAPGVGSTITSETRNTTKWTDRKKALESLAGVRQSARSKKEWKQQVVYPFQDHPVGSPKTRSNRLYGLIVCHWKHNPRLIPHVFFSRDQPIILVLSLPWPWTGWADHCNVLPHLQWLGSRPPPFIEKHLGSRVKTNPIIPIYLHPFDDHPV